jgi:hypothetical protein
MTVTRAYLALTSVATLMLTPRLAAQAPASNDSAAVRRAAMDYIEGFYEGDTAKLVRSIRPEVFKYVLWQSPPRY